ncbi:MAG: Uncharacterized protein Athens101428_329, partial [Candidatus Berkelbacteria bacterium Athens1014_28]
MQLKDYQEDAIEELLEATKQLLNYENQKLVLKAPTGSGKTIIMAEFLKQLTENPEIRQPLSFIWTAPRKLHIQSKEKLENYFEENCALKCSFFEDLDDRKIDENEILFFNWESINKKDNVYIRDNEQEFNLSKVVERTKEEGREIILIIDESHHHAKSDISQELIKMMGPILTIEVSATPKMEEPDEMVNVHLEDVKAVGMIKKAVIINDEIENFLKHNKIISGLRTGSEEKVLDLAIQKRRELVKAFNQEDVATINPLILIQLPDRKSQIEDEVKERIIKYLKDKHNISVENGKLGVYLSENYENLENITKNESEVEVLIFKQAITIGWDCPRAQILVLFRFWKSLTFSIQTVGRIMRMPELHHYTGHQILNYAHVYTNLENIEIQEDISKDYITIFTSKRIKDYKPINLLSYYSKRQRERTRLDPRFINIFLETAKKEKIKDKINIKSQKFNQDFIAKAELNNIDVKGKLPIVAEKRVKYVVSSLDLQKLLDYFARDSLPPEFYPEDRSIARVKESIYHLFEKIFNLTYEDEEKIVSILLDEKNIDYFKNLINIAKQKYQAEVAKREKELSLIEDWNVREIMNFNINYFRSDKKRSVMQPFYCDKKWKTEMAFIDFLEKQSNVEWWFKNGDRDATFLAVPYGNGEPKPFYVDFVIKLKDD